MTGNDAKREEIRKIILSLLLARQGATPVVVLDNDYYEAEGQRIPYSKFGHVSMVDFLESMPETFQIERRNGIHYVRGIATEKSKHVSSLVSRQKNTSKQYHRHNGTYRPNHYFPTMPRCRAKIPAELLSKLVQHVKQHPNGVTIQEAMGFIFSYMPHVTFSMYDLNQQLRELPHQLYVAHDIIYPVKINKHTPCESTSIRHPQDELQTRLKPCTPSSLYGVPEDLDDSGSNFVPAGFIKPHLRRPKNSEQPEASCDTQQSLSSQSNDDSHNDNDECSKDTEETEEYAETNISALISDRVQARLEQLMRKHPDGIRCAELPEMYLKEYKVSLNYADLGFKSVCDYVSCLLCVYIRQDTTGDFIMYHADQKPNELPKSSAQKVPNPRGHNMNYDAAPIPANISPTMCAKFEPEGVMTYEETVGHIMVTDLQNSAQHLEVYVVEVFTPSFFWIQLRGNKKHFEILMKELGNFYNQYCNMYSIPRVALKRGLNCVCIYANMWHRGIIKTVKPDFRVTVLFYDYGTLKTYQPENVFYLHKRFSYLPAQAIPCGLYNVKPCIGDRWKRSITDRFIDRIADSLLAATIVSTDPPNNSMLVILSDTSEEEDVHINEWLIQENLARRGNMVRMLANDQNFSFLRNKYCKSLLSSNFNQTTAAENIVVANTMEHNSKDQSLHKFSNVGIEKNVEALRNIPIGEKLVSQMTCDVKSVVTTPSHAKHELNSSTSKKPRGPKELIMLLEIIKNMGKINASTSGYDAAVTSQRNIKKNARQINSDEDTNSSDDKSSDIQDIRNIQDWSKEKASVIFSSKDFDEEDDGERYFGTFHSLYGGRGKMEPFDWSLIKKSDLFWNTPSCNNNLNSMKMGVQMKSDERNKETDQELRDEYVKGIYATGSCEKENKKAVKPNELFLKASLKEVEYCLAENNIDYDVKNVPHCAIKLRNRIKIEPVTAKQKALEDLPTSEHSFDANSKADSNNDATSSLTVASCRTIDENVTNKSGEICEMRKNEEIERKEDCNTDLKCASSNINNIENDRDKNALAHDTEFNPTKNTRYNLKMILKQMQQLKSSDFKLNLDKSSEESFNEQNLSSSFNDSSNDYNSNNTMISSENETLDQDINISFYYDDFSKQEEYSSQSKLQSSCNATLNSDPRLEDFSQSDSSDISFTNVADSLQILEQHKPDNKLMSRRMQMLLKRVNSNSDLDSDDFSDESKIQNESSDNLTDVSEINNDAERMSEKVVTLTDLNEYDMEFDETDWDVYAEP